MTDLTPAAQALLDHWDEDGYMQDNGLVEDIAAIQAEARASAEAEIAELLPRAIRAVDLDYGQPPMTDADYERAGHAIAVQIRLLAAPPAEPPA